MADSKPTELNQRYVEIVPEDLPLHCPMPSQKLWNAHPRVFLPIDRTGEQRCPYCGTLYRLIGGPCQPRH